MQRNWFVVMSVGLLVLLLGGVASAQMSPGLNPYSNYDGSTLMGNSSGAVGGRQMYYPYWHNYLDKMQQQGGYYSVTGNYGSSGPVTSYYPADGNAAQASTQGAAVPTAGANMYYNPSEYYGANAQGQQQAYGQGQQQAYGQGQQQAPSAYQQAPRQNAPAVTKRRAKRSKKKKRYSKRRSGGQGKQYRAQAYPNDNYYQRLYMQQQGQARQAAQQGQYQPQNPQAAQPGYYQQPGQPQPQPQTQPAQAQPTADPIVQRARQDAFERAKARQRAAELAGQQQAALQELQQARALYETAEGKVREQEERQKAFRQEYHRKATEKAYEGLKTAQQRYYELMGVPRQSGPPPGAGRQDPARAQAPPPPNAQPYPQPAAPAPGQGYGGQNQYASAPGMAPGAVQPAGPTQTPPTQATPLRVQSQQQQGQQGKGFWGTLKEMILPPGGSGGNWQRSLMEKRRGAAEEF
ncbi:hypothetical protein ACFL2Q_01600 [Thermodesulfobacteriota bacterium]